MRIFIAGLGTETNTASAWPTGRRNYEERGLLRGNARDDSGKAEALMLALFHERAESDGHSVVEGLAAFAEPAGVTPHSVYAEYRDEILDQLAAEGPFDVVLLLLHGAMVSTECDDCEGDLITRARAITGPGTIIGIELDPHCHLTQAMVEGSNAIVLMKEYPHDDFLPRANELYDICSAAAAGRVRPTTSVFDCRMVGFFPTTAEPMAGLLDLIRQAERRTGILSISFVHGFPWGDTPDTGAKILAIADNDPALSATVAAEIGRAIYARRDDLLPAFADVETALDTAISADGLTVLADTADNAGGGAPGDNTTLLRAILERQISGTAIGPFWDPIAASVCADFGEGERLALRLGGKMGPASGDPLDLLVTVRAVRHDFSQKGLGNSRQPMGLTVWVEVDPGIAIVICSVRTQAYHPDLFTGLGIDLSSRRLVAVKSLHHFHTGFAPIADRIIPVATTGALSMDFAKLPFAKKSDLGFHPRLTDPLADETGASPDG